MCAAPIGHVKWGNPVKPKLYEPQDFWDKCCEYFEWVDDNPWMKNEAIKSGERVGEIIQIPTQRPYSIEGLCNYLDMSVQTFDRYSKEVDYETYWGVSLRVREIIDNQHFEGGMVGAFNANIVTRKLGLADKQEVNNKNPQTVIINKKYD